MVHEPVRYVSYVTSNKEDSLLDVRQEKEEARLETTPLERCHKVMINAGR